LTFISCLSLFLNQSLFPRLESEKRQLENFKADLERGKQVVKDEEANLEELRKKEKKLSQAVDKAIEERREIKAEAEAGKKKLQDLAAELKALKEKHEELLQEIGALKKLTTSKENELQKNLAERHAIFKKCRMEEIDLPLKKGSLHDLNEVRTSCCFCFLLVFLSSAFSLFSFYYLVHLTARVRGHGSRHPRHPAGTRALRGTVIMLSSSSNQA